MTVDWDLRPMLSFCHGKIMNSIHGIPKSVRFGPYDVDLRSGELQENGKKIYLQKKSFEVLTALLEHPGEIVTREELQLKLWPDDVFVDFEDNLNTAVNRLRLALGDSAEKPQFIETLRGRGYRLKVGVSQTNFEVKPNTPPSVAVLPLANIGLQPDQEYFCDGLAENITNTLSHLQGLRVVARTSAYVFKGRTEDVREIGRKLNVNAILEGSVQHSGDRLRITIQLINVADGIHLWSDRYDRKIGDIFAIEDEISQAVACKLKTQLLQDDETRLLRRQTRNLAAYDLYLKGRYTFAGRSPDSAINAVQYFERALKEDPNYPLAHVGLAECYCQIGFMGYLAPRKVFPKALTAIGRALDIDPTLAEAYALLGFANWAYNWDWERAETCFLHAEELAPSCGIAKQWHSLLLSALGRFDEAIEQIDHAKHLDPLSLLIQTVSGLVLYLGRKYDIAIERYKAVLTKDPSIQIVYFHLGRAYSAMGNFEEAIVQLEKVPTRFPTARGTLGAVYEKAGRRDKTLEILQELKRASKRQYVGPLAFAMLYAALGDMNAALRLYDKAFKARDGFVPFLNVDPHIDALRSNPRFKAMLRRLNLPPKLSSSPKPSP
jgi:TolB-like protein/Tfp pilus assembly protein PilF